MGHIIALAVNVVVDQVMTRAVAWLFQVVDRVSTAVNECLKLFKPLCLALENLYGYSDIRRQQ